MPKTPRLKAALAPRVNDEPLVPDIMQDLLPEEKGELRAFFEGRVWKKVLANVRLSRPSLFPLGLDGALGPQIAINRLHQLQGWKLLEVALAQPIQLGGGIRTLDDATAIIQAGDRHWWSDTVQWLTFEIALRLPGFELLFNINVFFRMFVTKA